MAVQLPNGRNYFATATGAPLVGGRLYAFIPGTSTPKDTYTTSAGNVPNTHPVVADARGEMTIYWDGVYDVVLRDASDVLVWGPERLESPEVAILADLADTASSSVGDALIGVQRTASGAVATTVHVQNERRALDVAIDFGATSASSAGAVFTAVGSATAAAASLSRGGTVEIPQYVNYGYVVTTRATWPYPTSATTPVSILDLSQGSSYGTYPTTYDGCQWRLWMWTPQTTTPGQHDGCTFWLRGNWAPNMLVINDQDQSVRAATDNRRAYTGFGWEGHVAWGVGQGSQAGIALTNEEQSNFVIQKYNVTGDTLGAYFPLVVERKTGRQSWGGGTNAPVAHFDRAPSNPSDTAVPVMVVRTSGSTTAGVEVQSSSGSGSRSYFRNVSGNTEIGTTAGGTSIFQRAADSFIGFFSAVFTYHFNLQASRASNWIAFLNNTNSTDGFVQRLQSTSTQAATWDFIGCYANAGADARFFVRGTGNAVNANNSYGAISDEKLKQDIQDAGSAWEDFKAYRFRKYRFKSDPTGPLQLGVIAQEIEQVSPGLVSETPDVEIAEDGERVLTGTSTKEVKYSVLYAKACVVIQELMARVEALEKR